MPAHKAKGQPPNDLLDRRDQLVRELNQFVQTTSIPADDGTVGIFLAGSQPLVLGTNVSPVTVVSDDFGDPLKTKLSMTRDGQQVLLDENALGGGEVSGLLRFQNTDLAEGRNLLGRLTLAITTQMNTQHALGLDLDGNAGGPLFPRPGSRRRTTSVRPPHRQHSTPTRWWKSLSPSATPRVSLLRTTPSTSTRPHSGSIITALGRQSHQLQPDAARHTLATVDGITFGMPSCHRRPTRPSACRRRPLFDSTVCHRRKQRRAGVLHPPPTGSRQSDCRRHGHHQQRQLATGVAHGVNQRPNPDTSSTRHVLTFAVDAATNAVTYTRSDDAGASPHRRSPLTPARRITSSAWSLKLTGTPKNGDTFKVVDIKDPAFKLDLKLNGGNATAMMNLRDKAMFDGSVMTDGYASAISQIGIRTQSAGYSATVSSTIAANLEQDRSAVSGVNLDEEAAKLIQYQQAYQASAKMIQIAQNIFDTLIQGLGR